MALLRTARAPLLRTARAPLLREISA